MSRTFGDGSLDTYLRQHFREQREREAREAAEAKAKAEAEKAAQDGYSSFIAVDLGACFAVTTDDDGDVFTIAPAGVP